MRPYVHLRLHVTTITEAKCVFYIFTSVLLLYFYVLLQHTWSFFCCYSTRIWFISRGGFCRSGLSCRPRGSLTFRFLCLYPRPLSSCQFLFFTFEFPQFELNTQRYKKLKTKPKFFHVSECTTAKQYEHGFYQQNTENKNLQWSASPMH